MNDRQMLDRQLDSDIVASLGRKDPLQSPCQNQTETGAATQTNAATCSLTEQTTQPGLFRSLKIRNKSDFSSSVKFPMISCLIRRIPQVLDKESRFTVPFFPPPTLGWSATKTQLKLVKLVDYLWQLASKFEASWDYFKWLWYFLKNKRSTSQQPQQSFWHFFRIALFPLLPVLTSSQSWTGLTWPVAGFLAGQIYSKYIQSTYCSRSLFLSLSGSLSC